MLSGVFCGQGSLLCNALYGGLRQCGLIHFRAKLMGRLASTRQTHARDGS